MSMVSCWTLWIPRISCGGMLRRRLTLGTAQGSVNLDGKDAIEQRYSVDYFGKLVFAERQLDWVSIQWGFPIGEGLSCWFSIIPNRS
ncbi:hypothetical protein BC567DRAFT_221441 [Phyllosticta citribraziliensis]